MRRAVLFLLLSCVALVGAVGIEAADQGVKAVLELSQRFYYAGEPLNVRVSIGNDGDAGVENPVKTPLLKAFKVRDSKGKKLKATGQPNVSEPARPGTLAPKAFYGSIVDLSSIYPELRERGRFEIQWAADGIDSATIEIRIIPRYDATKDYLARVETQKGTFVIEFFKDVSPLAVKNFVDLAHADFYDGLTFHEVRRDHLLVTGDPTGTGFGGAGYSFPAEFSSLPVVAGTVLMKPASPSPPANGSQFMILLRPEPGWTGQFTVLGQVVRGFDVLREIAKVPTSERVSRPFFKPTQDIRVREVAIEEKSAAGSRADVPTDGGSG